MTETGAAHHAVDAVTSSSAAGAEGPTSFGIDCPTAGAEVGQRVDLGVGHRNYPEPWRARYTWVRDLPHGGNALVSLARTVDGTEVVVRQAIRPRGARAHHIQAEELRTMDHPNIVHGLDGPLEVGGYRWQVLEYCAQGSLTQVRTQGQSEPAVGEGYQPSPRDLIDHVVEQVAEGLNYLHETKQLIHTDIKPDNILMRADGSVALADLDLAVSVTAQPEQDEHTPGRTMGYDPQDPTFTPAFDWAQLGYTALSLATGVRRPARQGWGLDLESLDPRLVMLVKGLCARLPDDRWGYAQVRRWIEGEDVAVVEPAPSGGWGATSSNFVVHFAGQACTTPAALGDRMSHHWPETRRELQRQRGGEPYIRWLGDLLVSIGHPVAQRVLDLVHLRIGDPTQSLSPGPVVHPDQVAAMLITALNPAGPPRYALGDGDAIDLSAATLARTARNAAALVQQGHLDAYEVRWVSHLYQSGIMQAFSGMPGYAWLSELEDDWPHVMTELTRLLRWASIGASRSRATYREVISNAGLPEDKLFKLQRGDWEQFAAREESGPNAEFGLKARALALRALVDDQNAAELRRMATEAVARNGPSQQWFAHLDGRPPPPDTPGPTGYDPRSAVRPAPGLLTRLREHWTQRWNRRSNR
jgi:hypothetical protein